MKAIVSILFSIALIWSQFVVAAVSDSGGIQHPENRSECRCPKKMSCCAAPSQAPARDPLPASAATRSVSRDASPQLLSPKLSARLPIPPALPVALREGPVSHSSETASEPLYTRLRTFLI